MKTKLVNKNDKTPTVQDVSFTSPQKMNFEQNDDLSLANKSNNYEGTQNATSHNDGTIEIIEQQEFENDKDYQQMQEL